jgi:hypothetical protein
VALNPGMFTEERLRTFGFSTQDIQGLIADSETEADPFDFDTISADADKLGGAP